LWRKEAILKRLPLAIAPGLLLLSSAFSSAQYANVNTPARQDTEDIARTTEVKNLTYLSIGGQDLQLDVYKNPHAGPAPVLVYFHGGGWWKGSRPLSYGSFRPFIRMGFSVVSVDYRLTGVAPAPAAVQDARCALSWIKKNPATYGFDTSRIVVYGTSAGGHLALMSGVLPTSAGVDLPQCQDQPAVAAVLNFYGIADLTDLLKPEHQRSWAARWLGNGDASDRADLARRMSPISYVRTGVPPVLTVHGDSDPTVPYAQAVALKRALDREKVPNELFTVPGGAHGKFDDQQKLAIENAIRQFLIQHGVLRR